MGSKIMLMTSDMAMISPLIKRLLVVIEHRVHVLDLIASTGPSNRTHFRSSGLPTFDCAAFRYWIASTVRPLVKRD